MGAEGGSSLKETNPTRYATMGTQRTSTRQVRAWVQELRLTGPR
jgi:hypothetical protein